MDCVALRAILNVWVNIFAERPELWKQETNLHFYEDSLICLNEQSIRLMHLMHHGMTFERFMSLTLIEAEKYNIISIYQLIRLLNDPCSCFIDRIFSQTCGKIKSKEDIILKWFLDPYHTGYMKVSLGNNNKNLQPIPI